ncbi:MAG TPA: HAD family phosphatase [Candidatus Nanoarchaeia archaeon]|nr:HAD family phosphatase [Candidatus Nanoarchaeia archaeon]
MIKTILFDFGGVLGSDADTIFLQVLESNGITQAEGECLWEEHWPNLKLGKCGVDEIWKGFEERYGRRVDVGKIRKEYDAAISINAEVLGFARSLRDKGLRLAILANEAREWMQIKRQKGGLDQVFEKVYSSADIGLAKPDKRAYELVLREMELKGEEVVFIDNMERNLVPAKDMGMRCIFFKGLLSLKEELGRILG